MTTIKIKPSHPSQGEFVVIERADFDPAKHELCDGETLTSAPAHGDGETGDGVPTLAELIASRNMLLARSDDLDDRELALNQRSDALDAREQALLEREQANATEAQRLADLAAAQAAAGSPDYSAMTKEQLQAALDAKGTKYPAAANKADLIALLTAA